MYKLIIFDYGDWKQNERCFRIAKKDGDNLIYLWSSPSFPIAVTASQLEPIKEELKYACDKFGLYLNDTEPSIYEWYLEELPQEENHDKYITFKPQPKIKKRSKR